MKFSVIYDFDIMPGESVRMWKPPNLKLWTLTEGDSEYGFDYITEEDGKGKHRKYVAMLTRPQFEKFIEHIGLCAEDIETMGSIGAPGFGWGCSPAISFSQYGEGALNCNAYVTPIPDVQRKGEWTERDFQRIRRAMLSLWG